MVQITADRKQGIRTDANMIWSQLNSSSGKEQVTEGLEPGNENYTTCYKSIAYIIYLHQSLCRTTKRALTFFNPPIANLLLNSR